MDKARAKPKRKGWVWLLVTLLAVLLAVGLFLAWFWNLIPGRYYTAKDFDITVVQSPNDANDNGVDDYTDIVEGARQEAKSRPIYNDAYWEGGYPPDDIGVCTDTIWRAFAHAGYDLKALVDADIAVNPQLYPGLDSTGPDPNIDFRRVRNLDVYFQRYAETLTLDIEDIGAWQPGDIVVFRGGDHIAICSDKRNASGIPWLIHNGGQPNREEDALEKLLLYKELVGHYRWTPK